MEGVATLVTIQQLSVREGREEEFVARFRTLDVLGLAAEAASGELIEASMLQNGRLFLVVTSWLSEAGMDGWIASPARERVRAELEPLYDETPVVERYPIRDRYPSDDWREQRAQSRSVGEHPNDLAGSCREAIEQPSARSRRAHDPGFERRTDTRDHRRHPR